MKVVFDIEANGLQPTEIYCLVAEDTTTGERYEFTQPSKYPDDLIRFAKGVDCWIGHYILHYDLPVLRSLVDGFAAASGHSTAVDTLVISRLLDCNILGGHSLEAWGERLGIKKKHTDIVDWDIYDPRMLERCHSDVSVNVGVYNKFKKYLTAPLWQSSIEVEHFIAERCRELHDNGFHFDVDKAKELCYNIEQDLERLDDQLLTAFPPKVRLLREVTPRLTKYGTLNKADFRFVQDGDLSDYNGGCFSRIAYEDFNPASTPQIVERLNDAGWKPVEKTKGHTQALRDRDAEKIAKFKITGWTVSETNLETLPDTAHPAAKTLAKRIMLASRQRTLTEWINAYNPETHRIHGSFNGIGAWTHRMSHTNPNTGNIAREDALYGAEMRGMWSSPDGSYLVGVDAESIQLRVLAHYINDDKFTQSLLTGKKEDGTDPHSLNKIALGRPCQSRNHAKTFIYAWLLGAGVGKVADILECTHGEASKAVSDFIEFYPGLKHVKDNIIPADASRGYFQGFDGRWVKIVGEDLGSRQHFCLAGYLQNGEVTVMKHAMKIWYPQLKAAGVPFKIVNFVHDEWQTEVPSYDVGLIVANAQADAIRLAGESLNLRCPMAGSILSGHGGIAIGRNWLDTH
jgi:DNA polymerase-1